MPPDPDEHWKTINAFVHRFEVAWQHGGCPNIDDFLPKDGDPLRLDVLKELILVDIERRWAGEPARLEDYFERYPEAAALINGSTVAHELADQKPVNADPDLPERIGRYRVERILGQGSFGVVYLAHDDDLSRRVAIKVPHAKLIVHPEDAEEYRTEARTVAGLDHQNIVPVFDVGKTPEHPIFVVSKFIDGSTLARRIRENPLGVFEAAELVKVIAETLHYAHKKGLVHRDIKPGNILLEFRVGDGGLQVPYVADFGLALLEENVGRGPRFAGTPAYMSPEQARGEGNRVNGCSDIFSLGVVFYELLTGRRPFHAREQSELLDQITGMEARPPRQWVDTIPKELERICLKALSKRASDRYTTALDFADDLRHFLDADSTKNQRDGAIGSPKGSPGPKPSPGGPAGPLPPSENTVIKIVPQGLRSFDTGDADFFLELLPGPRDREGLPNSIRFWKTRVEEMDAGNTFAVGLIYGPSGCGKSSLVKAGLLPRLCPSVLTVYVEAAAEETEARLLSGLRRRCPSVSADLGLKETLASLRRGQGMPSGQKVLIVLDQFEQWLHAAGAPGAAVGRSRKTAELVNALRQCDGVRVQCIVMVRDDFWLAVSRFLKELEIELLENRNSAMVDLFDTDHALKVLAAFGRAFDKLADSSVNAAKEQKLFMARAIEGLAQDDKVICVRLALFAEMMKSKPWTLASLNAVGGTSGLGVTFLEEKFSAATTPAAHRHHQKAARGVLKALLPEPGADIKGHVKSSQELMAASGYTSRPDDFASLIKILDSELRLITPTEAEGKDEDGGAAE